MITVNQTTIDIYEKYSIYICLFVLVLPLLPENTSTIEVFEIQWLAGFSLCLFQHFPKFIRIRRKKNHSSLNWKKNKPQQSE